MKTLSESRAFGGVQGVLLGELRALAALALWHKEFA